MSDDLLRGCTDYTQVKHMVKGMMDESDVKGYRTLRVYPDAIDDIFTEFVDPNYVESMAPPYDSSCPGI